MKLKFFTVCALAALATACSFKTLPKPGSNAVKVAAFPPKTCHFIGEINVMDVNGATIPYSSHEEIQDDQLVRLKNDAVRKGANVIVITRHQTTYQNVKITYTQGVLTQKGSDSTVPENDIVNTHKMSADAYYCSSDALTALKTAPKYSTSDANRVK